MSQPKRHHYVPQFLLRRFVDENGQLAVYRKSDGKTWTTTPGNLFVERDLYSTTKDGTLDPKLEHEYSQLEGDANLVISRFIASAGQGQIPVISSEEKRTFGDFFYQQIKRVPEMFRALEVQKDFANRLEQKIGDVESRLGYSLSEDEKSNLLTPQSISRIQKNATVKSLGDINSNIRARLLSMSLEIVVAPAGVSFVIGSQPVSRSKQGNPVGSFDPNVHLWLPVSSSIAVRYASFDDPIRIANVSSSEVDSINRQIYRQSEMIAGNKLPVLLALAASSSGSL